jgi:hypothetical protein
MRQSPRSSYPQWPVQPHHSAIWGLTVRNFWHTVALYLRGYTQFPFLYTEFLYVSFPARQRVNPAFSLGKKNRAGRSRFALTGRRNRN